jgi:hypothetical protein
MDIEERYLLKRTGQGPATAMPFFGPYITLFPQPRHGSAHDDGIGAQHRCNCFGGRRTIVAIHMDQNMQQAG